MIYKVLQLVSNQLNSYLKLSFGLHDDIAFLSPVTDNDKVYPTNRVAITLAGLERETSAGITFQRKAISGTAVKNTAPAWQVNVHILIAVLFQDRQYEESIQILSAIVKFVQKNNVVASQNNEVSVALDIVNLSVHEMSNLWGICGGTYYPSILCRLRVLTIDEQEITDLSAIMSSADIHSKVKNNN